MKFSYCWLFLIVCVLSPSGWAEECDGQPGTPRCYIQIGSVLPDRAGWSYINGVKQTKICLSDNNRPNLDIQAFVDEINSLNDGKGFLLTSKNHAYQINYTEITYPVEQWSTEGNCTKEREECLASITDPMHENVTYCRDSELHCHRIGESLTQQWYPDFHFIVGPGSGCSPDRTYVMPAAEIANNVKRIWMTNRGPEVVITNNEPNKPYVFSIHLNSDDYAKLAIKQWEQSGLESVAIFYEDNKASDGSSARNDFFYGVGNGAVRAALGFNLPIVVNGTFDDITGVDTENPEIPRICDGGTCIDPHLIALLNEAFEKKAQAIVLSSKQNVFRWLMSVLKSREAEHRFQAVFWVGVSWSTGKCNGVPAEICEHAIGATQTHGQEGAFTDKLLNRPANKLGEAGIESDVYCGISTFVQVLKKVFAFRTLENPSNFLDDEQSYTDVLDLMISGERVAETWYGIVAFNEDTGQNEGRDPVTVQAHGNIAMTVLPIEYAQNNIGFTFPSPATKVNCPVNTFMEFNSTSCPLCSHECVDCPPKTITPIKGTINANRIDCKCSADYSESDKINNCTTETSVCNISEYPLKCTQSDCTLCPDLTNSPTTSPISSTLGEAENQSTWTDGYTAAVVIAVLVFVILLVAIVWRFLKQGDGGKKADDGGIVNNNVTYHDVRMMNPTELSDWLKKNGCKEMAFAANTNNITGVMWLKQGEEEWEDYSVMKSEYPRITKLMKSLKS